MSEFLAVSSVGPEYFGSSTRTGQRWLARQGLEIFLINGRKHVRRADIVTAIEASRICQRQPGTSSSIKHLLDAIAADVIAKRRATA